MVFIYLSVICVQSVISEIGMLFAVYHFIGSMCLQGSKRLGVNLTRILLALLRAHGSFHNMLLRASHKWLSRKRTV